MWGILMYYLDEYLYYRETGRQMLYDTGLKKRPMQQLLDWLSGRRHRQSVRRAAKWNTHAGVQGMWTGNK